LDQYISLNPLFETQSWTNKENQLSSVTSKALGIFLDVSYQEDIGYRIMLIGFACHTITLHPEALLEGLLVDMLFRL
jgi:hypothetical protein